MEEWSYQPAPDLEQSVAERLRNFPRYPDMTIYVLRSLLQIGLRGFLRLYHRFRVEGREHLPREGSFVMVGNHASHLDAPCLLSSLPLRRLHRAFPAAAADYFFSSLPRSLFTVIFVNALPFDRQKKGAESLEICRQLLERPGNILILFPEGTRSPTGEIGRFLTGIGRLTAGTTTPVVPCYLEGASAAFPKGALLPRPRKLTLRFGPPRTFAEISSKDRDAVKALCARLREDVVALAREDHDPGGA